MSIHTPTTNRHYQRHNLGFSLLELSISIAIIALLITAVVAGQSIKQRLALHQMIEDMGILNTASKEFKTAYKGLAGDLFNAETVFGQDKLGNKVLDHQGDGNGNGNNILEDNLTSPARNEKLLFWQHLSAAGLITGTYDGSSLGSSGMYLSPFKDTYYEPNTDSHAGNRLYFRISTLSAGALGYGAFTTEDAFNYDTKYDDGNPTTGTIRALESTGQVTGNCMTAGGYNLAYTAKNACQLLFYVE